MSKYKHIDDFIKIPQLNNNDRLFHYTSAAGVKGITDGEFWITESHFLNDSTEFTIGTDICMEILEKHMRNPRRLLYAKDLLMEQMRKYYREEQEDTVSGSAEGSYVISFCTSGDSLLMWSEYSDFMGYCMEFEYGKLKETFQEHCGNDSTLFDGKVIYDHDEQIELLEDTIESISFVAEQICVNLSMDYAQLFRSSSLWKSTIRSIYSVDANATGLKLS